MFALSALSDEPLRVRREVRPRLRRELREAHEAIIPGYHLNKRHWITVTLGGDASDDLVRLLVAESHALVAPGAGAAGAAALPTASPAARINREVWDGLAGEFAADGELKWAMDDPVWGIWKIPEQGARCCPTSRASTSSSSGAARRTGRPGWRDAEPGRPGSTTPPDSSRRPGGCNASTGSTSPSSMPAGRRSPSRMGASIWPSRSTGPACGATRALDSRGGTATPARRPARVPHPLADPHAVHPGLRRLPDQRPAGRPYFGMRRFDWQDHPSIEFNLTYGGWIAELGRSGFTVEALHECRRPRTATPGATTTSPPTGRTAGLRRRSGWRACAADWGGGGGPEPFRRARSRRRGERSTAVPVQPRSGWASVRQAPANRPRDEEAEDGDDHGRDPPEPDLQLVGDPEGHVDAVGGARDLHHRHLQQQGHAQAGAERGVARPLVQVVRGAVAEAAFERRPGEQDRDTIIG